MASKRSKMEVRKELASVKHDSRSCERMMFYASREYSRRMKLLDRHRASLAKRETKLQEQLAAL